MPVHFIQKAPTGSTLGLTDGVTQPGNVASIGVDSTLDSIVFNGSGSRNVVPKSIYVTIPINASSVDTNVWIAPTAHQIVSISEVHSVVGGASAAVDVKKCTGTTAPASGTTVFASSTIDLTATINTNQTPTLTATVATLKLAAGDRIAFDFSGTLTGLVGVVVIQLKKI